jgi:signal transduction histidine kinase
MSDAADVIALLEDEPGASPAADVLAWKVAVIDDDLAVHDGTRFALQTYRLKGRGLELVSAFSAAEGRELLIQHPDTAVILLDVVMETDEAGLDLVRVIREELANEAVRIILRTGQPGQAPEQRIVIDYDINDYKAKTELTAEKLFTCLTAALRGYEQLRRLADLTAELAAANRELEDRIARRTEELVAANRRLEAQWERLRRANAFKSEMLGTVAHDLKNPLSVILGRTEILTDLIGAGAPDAERILGQVEHIRGSALRLTEMVDSLIRDAKADAVDITIRREPVDLAALAREVAEANAAAAGRKEQRIGVAAPASLFVSGDVDRLREALDNLVSNAVKFSPKCGAIEVTVARQGDEIVLSVLDEGPGLKSEDAARLFRRFQRLSARPTGGESSTGLGLSIAKRIVELHDGRIAGEPRPSGGAVFTVALPSLAPAKGG